MVDTTASGSSAEAASKSAESSLRARPRQTSPRGRADRDGRAGVTPNDIDLLLLGTTSPDNVMPSTACITQAKLGLTCPAVDVKAACTGFVYAPAALPPSSRAGPHRAGGRC